MEKVQSERVERDNGRFECDKSARKVKETPTVLSGGDKREGFHSVEDITLNIPFLARVSCVGYSTKGRGPRERTF